MDSEENLYLSSCNYSAQKDTWKKVLKDQLIQSLKDIEAENSLVKSETRYFEVSPEQNYKKEKYEIKFLEYIEKVNRER